MESHVAGEGGTITHPHLLTLTLRYWTTAALSVYLTDGINYYPDIFDNQEVSVLLYLKNDASTRLKGDTECAYMLNLTCYNM